MIPLRLEKLFDDLEIGPSSNEEVFRIERTVDHKRVDALCNYGATSLPGTRYPKANIQVPFFSNKKLPKNGTKE